MTPDLARPAPEVPPRRPRRWPLGLPIAAILLAAPLWLTTAHAQTTAPAKPAEVASQPATRAGPVAFVSSLAQLRAQVPAMKGDDWELRLGWAESGVEDAPWKLLYAHYLYTGTANPPKALPDWGDYSREFTLGPLGWELHCVPPDTPAIDRVVLVDGSRESQLIRHSTERVFCAVIPIPLAGTYEIKLGGQNPAIAMIPVKQAPVLSWFALFSRQPHADLTAKVRDVHLTLASNLQPATPAYTDQPIFLRDKPKAGTADPAVFAKSLPGQAPGDSDWRRWEREGEVFRSGPLAPLRIEGVIADGKLVLRCIGFTPRRPDREFIVQWRVNGKPVAADPPKQVLQPPSDGREPAADGLAVKDDDLEEATLTAPLVLPASLADHARVGDQVALDVLFCPSGWLPVTHPDDITFRRDNTAKGICQPVMALPITFRVNEELLRDPRPASQPITRPAPSD